MIQQYTSTLGNLGAMYPLIRSALHYHRNTRGKPLRFAGMPFLVPLYANLPKMKNVVFRKCVQTGVSELAVQLALYSAGWNGEPVAYILPTTKIRNRFVQTRVDRAIKASPAYRERLPGGLYSSPGAKANSLSLKDFGTGKLFFLSAKIPTDFQELSADLAIIDEFDECDPENLAMVADRLRASSNPRLIRIGNTHIAGRSANGNVGVEGLYDEESDRQRWHFPCTSCGHLQPIDWFDQVVRQHDDGQWYPRDEERVELYLEGRLDGLDVRPICRQCAQPFDRRDRGGVWIPLRPDRSEANGGITGIHMVRMDVTTDRLADLTTEWRKAQGSTTKVAAFKRGALAITHEAVGVRLSSEHLDRCCALGEPLDQRGGSAYDGYLVTMGMDVGGHFNHVVITVLEEGEDGHPFRRGVFTLPARTFDEALDLMERFRVTVCVVDAGPETRKAKEFQAAAEKKGLGEVWRCEFQGRVPRLAADPFGMIAKRPDGVVKVNRTELLDATTDDIVEGHRGFPSDAASVKDFYAQMKAPKRTLSEDGQRIIWTKGEDHYRLADAYDRLAYELLKRGMVYRRF